MACKLRFKFWLMFLVRAEIEPEEGGFVKLIELSLVHGSNEANFPGEAAMHNFDGEIGGLQVTS